MMVLAYLKRLPLGHWRRAKFKYFDFKKGV